MLSGIGPGAHLCEHGIPVIADRAGVGGNLQDHLELYVQMRSKKPVTLYRHYNWPSRLAIGARWMLLKSGIGASNQFESAAFVRSAAGVDYPDIQFHFLPLAVRYDGKAAVRGHGFQAHVGPMRSPSRGTVRLGGADPATPPLIRFNYMSHAEDWRDFRRCIRLTREIFAQPALAPYAGAEIQPGAAAQSDGALDDFVRENAESAYHPCGTARLGRRDDPLAVVDPQARVIGVERLRVADSSLFPRITNGNLNAPSIMVGEKAADHILGRDPLPPSNAAPVGQPALAGQRPLTGAAALEAPPSPPHLRSEREERRMDDLPTLDERLDPDEADAIVAAAAIEYFDGCRARVDGFVDRNFSVVGSARLHRRALGLDLLRAPANVALSLPQVALKLSSVAARRLGRPGAAEALGRRNLLLETAVARELRWRLMTELLRLPFRDGDRSSTADGLAEAIIAAPQVQALLQRAGDAVAARRDDPAFRARLETALADYAGTRAAAAEITTGLLALSTGAIAFKQATPGALALGPIIAASLAQGSAIASFPLGAGLGSIWYGYFPAQASGALVAGATAGVLGVAAVATAFAGMLSDPVQRALGLHRRRLIGMIGGLEDAFSRRGGSGPVPYDLYVARLLDLGDVLISISRGLRSG